MATRAPDRTHPAQSLALLAHLARVSAREAETAEGSGTLRPRHYVALTLLRDHGETSQRALADALRLDPTNLVGLLNDLEQLELLARRRDPEDRRRHIVAITTAGMAELEATERRLEAVEERVLSALSADERATLHGLLMRAAGGQMPQDACTETDGAPGLCSE